MIASSLLYIEQRLNRVNGYRHLSKLSDAIQKDIGIIDGKEVAA
jgi:hypothetical protein